MQLDNLVQQRLNSMIAQRKALVESWAPYLKAVENYKKEHGEEPLREMQKFNIAQCLENALFEGGMKAKNSKIFETTYSDNITFLGVQLPVIAAILPSLVLDEIAIVQALDRRQGAVFFLDVQYGTTKGEITSGTTFVGAKTGHGRDESSREYATARVYNESLGTKSTANVFSATLANRAVVTGTTTVVVKLANGTVEDTLTVSATNGTTDTLTGATLTGSVVLATGVITVNGGASSDSALASYRYNYEKGTNVGVPEVNINLTSENIAAEDFILRTKYTMGAAIDLEKAHGINLEEEMVKYLGGEIKFEMDHKGIDQIITAAGSADAATAMGTFTATVGSEAAWLFKKYQFLDFIEVGSNNIFTKTLRGKATFVVCGVNAARIIKQLKPEFVEANEGKKPTGPHVIGKLNGMTVVVDPFISANQIVLGYRGDNFLEAGLVFAPYIPLFSTPTLITSDLQAQKGFMSSAGYKIVNAGFYSSGTVTPLSY